MAINRNKAQNKQLKFNNNAPIERQIDEIRRVVGMLWDEKNRTVNDIASLINTVDFEVPTKRMLELISEKWGHSGEMPDKNGIVKDHDARYYPRPEALWQLRRIQPLVAKDGIAITASDKQNITIDTGAGI